MSDLWNRCDVCGRFIPMADFGSGAIRRLIYPDSDRTEETWETLCRRHADSARFPSLNDAVHVPSPDAEVRRSERRTGLNSSPAPVRNSSTLPNERAWPPGFGHRKNE